MRDVLQQGQNLYRNYTPEYFPGSQVAPISPWTTGAAQGFGGFGGSPFNQQVVGNTLQGQQSLMGPNPSEAVGAGVLGGGGMDFLTGIYGQRPQSIGPVGGENLGANPGIPQSVYGARQFDPYQYMPGATGLEMSMRQAADPSAALRGAMSVTPGSNPYVDQMIASVAGQNTQNFQRNVLPDIRNQQELAGGYGGSRQGIAEGIAMGDLARANADAAAQINMQAYNTDSANRLVAAGLGANIQQAGSQADLARLAAGMQGAGMQAGIQGEDLSRFLQAAATGGNLQLAGGAQTLAREGLNQNAFQNWLQNAMTGTGLGASLLQGGTGQRLDAGKNLLALSPALQQMGLVGPQAMQQAGGIDSAYRQALLDDEIARFNYYQQLPWSQLSNYNSLVNGIAPGMFQPSMTSRSGGVAGALGGAAGGAGIASGIMSAMGPTAAANFWNPWGWALMGGGALLGALS